MIPSTLHHMYGKTAPNPHIESNAAKMKKRGAKWVFISQNPVWQYDEIGRKAFHSMTPGKTYVRKDPKPLNKKERRRIAKQQSA